MTKAASINNDNNNKREGLICIIKSAHLALVGNLGARNKLGWPKLEPVSQPASQSVHGRSLQIGAQNKCASMMPM